MACSISGRLVMIYGVQGFAQPDHRALSQCRRSSTMSASATETRAHRRHGDRQQPNLEPEVVNAAMVAKAGLVVWSKGLSEQVGKHGIA
jgi:hypothetical protein